MLWRRIGTSVSCLAGGEAYEEQHDPDIECRGGVQQIPGR